MAVRVTVRDVEYQPGFLARAYQPEGSGPFPLLLDIHGGGWNSGDRSSNETMDTDLAGHGIAVVSVDFRQPPAYRYPDSLADINLAARWLKAHASDFGGRPDRVGGIGSSSGAHQITLAAMRPCDPRYAALPFPEVPDMDARLACVVACWPVADPLARYRMAQKVGNESLVKGHQAYWGSEEAMAEGNPTLLLEREEKAELPPALVVQGTADENVTPDMADRFVAAYRKAGGRIELKKYEGMPHSFIKRSDGAGAAADALEAIREFVFARLG